MQSDNAKKYFLGPGPGVSAEEVDFPDGGVTLAELYVKRQIAQKPNGKVCLSTFNELP